MRSTIKFFIDNTVAANLLMVFILIIGIFSLTQLKTTLFPEFETRLISIQLVYPGASPEEIEEGVVSKIEENLVGIEGVKQTSSTSSENAASILIEGERGSNIDQVLQDVKNAVDQISSFPRNLEPPIIFKVEIAGGPGNEAYIFSLSGDLDLKTLKRYAQDIEDDLLALDQISQVEISGYPEEEISINFREADMRALNITFNEAVAAVAQNNLLTTGGTVKTSTEDLLIRAKNKEYFAKDFADIVVRSNPRGGVIKLHQIATITDQWQDNPTRTFINQDPGVVITVFNRFNEDMFEITKVTKEYLEEYKKKYTNVTVQEIRDGKEYLNGRIEFIKVNGLQGFFIVLVLLSMFLNVRLAFWVALAIPISYAGMFIFAAYLGVTINVISTFGMIVVIGILVDDGIVIAENIFQHYERGSPPLTAALEGTMEVLPAVTSAIITTVIAFSSFFFIDGFLGDVFPQLSIVVIFTLIFSLIEGAFILPAHIAHSKALVEGNGNKITAFFDRVMNYLKEQVYGPVLKTAMTYAFPTVFICAAALILVIGALMGGVIKATFFPNVQEDRFTIEVEMPPGTRESEISNVLLKLEKAAVEVSQELIDQHFEGKGDIVQIYDKRIGPTTYQGNLSLYLMKGEERGDELNNRMIVQKIREKVGPLPEVNKLAFSLGNVFGEPVSISLLGKNPDQLVLAVNELKGELRKIEDLIDIQDTNKEGLKEISLDLTPKALNLGFTLQEVVGYVRQGFFGAEIQRLQRGSDEIKVWVRYDEKDRSSIKDLAEMRIRTVDGQSIPLSDLATFKTERGVININHLNGQREIRVTADVASDDVSISDINSDIQQIILPKILANYPAVRVGLEGQAKENIETTNSMQRVMPVVFLCMFFVIILTFSSVSQALIVYMLFPFGVIGVGFGHWIMNTPISFLSMLGVVALIGIMVNDALVFIAAFNGKIKAGEPFKKALYDTGISRFRPISLTTITTVAGLMPLMLEKSVQAQFLIPMAISIAFGLMVTTFILLVMIPALMVISNRIKMFTTSLWTGETYTMAMVEPSYPGRKHPWFLTLLAAIVVLAGMTALIMATFKISEFIA